MCAILTSKYKISWHIPRSKNTPFKMPVDPTCIFTTCTAAYCIPHAVLSFCVQCRMLCAFSGWRFSFQCIMQCYFLLFLSSFPLGTKRTFDLWLCASSHFEQLDAIKRHSHLLTQTFPSADITVWPHIELHYDVGFRAVTANYRILTAYS